TRRAPTVSSVEHLLQLAELRGDILADGEQRLSHPLYGRAGGVLNGRRFLTELAHALAGAGDGEPLVVEQVFDLEELLNVAPRVDALAPARLLRTDRTELRLPIAQRVAFDANELRYLTDAVVQLDWDLG